MNMCDDLNNSLESKEKVVKAIEIAKIFGNDIWETSR